MAATNDQISKSVTPGSMAYGNRQQFTGSLGAGGAPPGAAGGPAPAGGAGMAPSPSDPMGMLLGGGLGKDDQPLTSGLSVGPGPGPAQGTQIPDDIVDRLRLVALNAKSPMLRASARAALRRRLLETGAM